MLYQPPDSNTCRMKLTRGALPPGTGFAENARTEQAIGPFEDFLLIAGSHAVIALTPENNSWSRCVAPGTMWSLA